MIELLPVANGLVLGAIAGQYQQATRPRLVLLVSITGGVVATFIGQLYHPDPSMLLVDFTLVAISATVGLLGARRFSLGRRRN